MAALLGITMWSQPLAICRQHLVQVARHFFPSGHGVGGFVILEVIQLYRRRVIPGTMAPLLGLYVVPQLNGRGLVGLSSRQVLRGPGSPPPGTRMRSGCCQGPTSFPVFFRGSTVFSTVVVEGLGQLAPLWPCWCRSPGPPRGSASGDRRPRSPCTECGTCVVCSCSRL